MILDVGGLERVVLLGPAWKVVGLYIDVDVAGSRLGVHRGLRPVDDESV